MATTLKNELQNLQKKEWERDWAAQWQIWEIQNGALLYEITMMQLEKKLEEFKGSNAVEVLDLQGKLEELGMKLKKNGGLWPVGMNR